MEVFEKESHLRLSSSNTNTSSSSQYGLPPEVEHASALWPFAPLHPHSHSNMSTNTNTLTMHIVSQLPPIDRATALVEAYFTNLAWFLGPIERVQVVDELLPLFYPSLGAAGGSRRKTTAASASTSASSTSTSSTSNNAETLSHLISTATDSPHDLALLFTVFACGAVADLTQPPDNVEALRFNALSRATLGLYNLFEAGSLSACQAVFLNGSFEVYSGKRASQESAWKMFSLAMCLASSVSGSFLLSSPFVFDTV